ncbi:3'-5' exoribonuclease YhaM family protein [Granulicella rosea]|nr:HD domain-containing protein [Granulicella rosea]
MKDFYISDAVRFENEVVTSYFCLTSIATREKKTGGGQYLAITLGDRTGTFEARMWDNFADTVAQCNEGCYVKAKGQVSKYQGKFQITLQQMRLASESEVDASDFQPVSRFDPAEMEAELRRYVAEFRNDDLRRLVLAFLDDVKIGAAFRVAPAAKYLHHAWLHGLLEHVLTLVRVCRATAPFYPDVDPDLLVTGAILHDIGKTRELHWKPSFGYTIEGQMIGHISIAQGMLREKLRDLSPFPERLGVLVEHMILSHHGKYEFGSPKLPMTPEALLLNVLDDLEAKMQNMRSEFDRELAAGKSGAGMTEWVRSMERPLLNSQAYLAEGTKEAAVATPPAPVAPAKVVEREVVIEAPPSLFD